MAGNARQEVEAAVQDLILETKCPICLDFFTNPRSAPCQHSFCEECIWEYIKDSHSECPSCRNPGTNRRSLSRNTQLRNITGIVKRLANALGLVSPEEELLGASANPQGHTASAATSTWGNGQKQAERHVGRRHQKGRRGGDGVVGSKTRDTVGAQVQGGHSDGVHAVGVREERGKEERDWREEELDTYSTPASSRIEGRLGDVGDAPAAGGGNCPYEPTSHHLLSAHATAAKVQASGTAQVRDEGYAGDRERGSEPQREAASERERYEHEDTTANDAALAAALSEPHSGGKRRRRGVTAPCSAPSSAHAQTRHAADDQAAAMRVCEPHSSARLEFSEALAGSACMREVGATASSHLEAKASATDTHFTCFTCTKVQTLTPEQRAHSWKQRRGLTSVLR
jgi:hypothetical protein